MQIVIDIPEEFYNDILNHVGGQQGITAQALVAWKAVERGTPLPKGHGRLVDEYDVMESYEMGEYDLNDCPTIIEADEEVEE